MTQIREKWDSMFLSGADFYIVGKCHDIPCFNNCKREHFDEKDFRHSNGNYFRSAPLKVTWFQFSSKFFLNNYDAHWKWHLKDTLQLKILRKRINIQNNCFLGKYHEMKMGKVALEIISCTKIQACSLKNIAPRQLLDSSLPLKQT